MYLLLKAAIVIFLTISINCENENIENENIENELEFIEMLRQTVRRLETNGAIRRDYESYTEPQLENGEVYDFIIVGAGSSGSALVYRLSEIYQWKILLLEAGGEPDILTDIPFWSPILHYTKQNWRFFSEREHNNALGLVNQRIHYARGRGLGGSSLLNYMIFSRGVKADFDKWARLGNPGWSYKDVLPIFKRLENCTLRFRDELYRGYHGPISASHPYISQSGEVFVEAAKNAGYRYVDYNGRDNKGVSFLQANIRNGLRCSGERCYLRPIRNRPNLTIRPHSQVTKILLTNNIAYGVEFYRNGSTYSAYAKKEVILSAGAISSPHILLLSGIGPKEQLIEFGIKPVKNLPVGQKMLDHPTYWGLEFLFNKPIDYNVSDALSDRWFVELYNEGRGLLTSAATGDNILFTRTKLAPNKITDVEILYLGTSFSTTGANGVAGLLNVNNETLEYTYRPFEGQYSGSCAILLLHPKSFGRVELRSADPFVYPKIYARFFTDPGNNDIKTLIAGIRETNRIMRTPPFNKYGARPIDRPIFGCQHLRYDSDEYWECALRHLTSSIFHPTTTCKMGPARDPEAVVDSRLRVHGMYDLRVVDSSVIPISITGHINIPAYMIGEKAADIIKEDYLYDLV